jgi:hypothetical protein
MAACTKQLKVEMHLLLFSGYVKHHNCIKNENVSAKPMEVSGLVIMLN